MRITGVLIVILVVLMSILVGLSLLKSPLKSSLVTTLGGVERRTRSRARERALESENVVVDTLNLVHWLGRDSRKAVRTCDIVSAIDETAPILRRRFPGRVIFVTKTRETPAEGPEAAQIRALYQAASRRNKVYVNVVERLPDSDAKKSQNHAALGRDDFYLIMLAWKLNCPVLSRDRFRDLRDMKTGHLDKFHVYSYSPFKNFPDRDFVNPAAAEFARMRRPLTIDYPDVFPDL